MKKLITLSVMLTMLSSTGLYAQQTFTKKIKVGIIKHKSTYAGEYEINKFLIDELGKEGYQTDVLIADGPNKTLTFAEVNSHQAIFRADLMSVTDFTPSEFDRLLHNNHKLIVQSRSPVIADLFRLGNDTKKYAQKAYKAASPETLKRSELAKTEGVIEQNAKSTSEASIIAWNYAPEIEQIKPKDPKHFDKEEMELEKKRSKKIGEMQCQFIKDKLFPVVLSELAILEAKQ